MKTLIITDLQNDFMPNGALGVPHADRLAPLINRLMDQFDRVIATMDWHPPNHISFAVTHGKQPGEKIRMGEVEQILWPVHCVQNTHGAELVHGLHRDRIERVFHKGVDPKVDSYSVFFDSMKKRSTGLANYLREQQLNDLYFVGVATDYCVLYSVLDALDLGFSVTVIRDACQAINLQPGDEEKALAEMEKKGARILKKNIA